MSDTTKRIEELKERVRRDDGFVASQTANVYDAIALAESLAAELEAIRGAGDEEVEECAREAENGIGTDWYGDRKGCQNASEYLEKLKDISIARGRDRDAALKRVAELEEMLRLREMSGIDGKEPTDG